MKQSRPFWKKLVIDIAGFSLLISSVALGWLPGPGGIPMFFAGLAFLATNHHWAEQLLTRAKNHGSNLAERFFPRNHWLEWVYDIAGAALLALVVWGINSVSHTLAKGALVATTTLILVILLLNRGRNQWLKHHVGRLRGNK